MKKSHLNMIITTLLIGASVPIYAQTQLSASEQNLQTIGQQTFERIDEMYDLAQRGEGTFTKNGENYLRYKEKDYWLNFDNYPIFALNDESAYRNALDFIDDDWEFISFDGGFYLLNLEFGGMNNDDTGCYVEYIPASRGSILPNGNFAYENPMMQNIESTDCKGITEPALNEFAVSSLSDQGVTFSWEDQQAEDSITITIRNLANTTDVKHFKNVSEGFFIGKLTPSTSYQVEISNCNPVDCAAPLEYTFTTLPAQLGFADDAPFINHLDGSLGAQLSFAQTGTTTAPFGNEEAGDPDLVINRAAMLLVNPEKTNINQLWVDVFVNGVLQTRLPMSPPSALAGTDQPNNGRQKVVFSHNAWSLPLQWDWMKPGISLRFTDNNGQVGELAASHFVFAGAPELVIQNIDIGMLMEPKDKNTMIKEMASLSADYFQKIPVSKLIIADYTAAHFPKITMPNGKVYTERSDDDGGWHGGDMRGDIGKALVSIGINNANFGISDTAGSSQSYSRRFNHITAHTNNGMYQNGEINHGGSGGGGIVTLTDTTGNEWSHELGHNYGLGHYPDQASSHDQESGWGWDALYNRFIGNLHWTSEAYTNDTGGEVVPPFANDFGYLKDAQAGGFGTGIISRYTLHHPKMNRRAANWFNSANMLDANSSTGYSTWNQEQQRYVESEVDYAAPVQQGVAVITLLGVYDPSAENPSQIYPLLNSNYGNVFELPAPETLEFQLEGWQPAAQLTEEQLLNTTWQTMKVDNEWLPLCQFSYTAGDNKQANFVGYLDSEKNTCQVTAEQYWLVDGQRETPVSQQGDYQLLSSKGNSNGMVTYTPTSELGEQVVCTLDKSGTDHDGAGFDQGGHCRQVAEMKHNNGRDWVYANHQGGIKRYSLQTQGQCQLSLTDSKGRNTTIGLAGSRHNAGQSNKYHVNIPAGQRPTEIELSCSNITGKTVLDTQYPEYNPAVESLVGPIIIGQEYGYDAVQSEMPEGWFAHPEQGFNPDQLNAHDRTLLAKMSVAGEQMSVCRFEMNINDAPQTLHGYVEQLSEDQYRCTGGSEISARQTDGETSIESAVNQFEWLSLSNRDNVGTKVKAYKDSDEDLCVVNRSGFYGLGFVNDAGQCLQLPEIYWSNGKHWTFSTGHSVYSQR